MMLNVMMFNSLLFLLTVSLMVFVCHKVYKNGKAPVLTVVARVADKREVFLRRRRCRSYYAVFEVESGDHMEFSISVSEYDALSKGDIGKLTFQGTTLGSFKRIA